MLESNTPLQNFFKTGYLRKGKETMVNEAKIVLDEETKEKLFNDFLIRMSTMEKEEMTKNGALNRKALSGMKKYFVEAEEKLNDKHYRRECMRYDIYKELRKIVPILVTEKLCRDNEIAGSDTWNYNRRGYVLETEQEAEEATKVGKILIDAMFGYLGKGNENGQ